jgi:hypothetical protein
LHPNGSHPLQHPAKPTTPQPNTPTSALHDQRLPAGARQHSDEHPQHHRSGQDHEVPRTYPCLVYEPRRYQSEAVLESNLMSGRNARNVLIAPGIQRRSLRAEVRKISESESRGSSPVVIGRIASDLRVPATTVERYIGLLEEVLLIKRVPAWSNSSNDPGDASTQALVRRHRTRSVHVRRTRVHLAKARRRHPLRRAAVHPSGIGGYPKSLVRVARRDRT